MNIFDETKNNINEDNEKRQKLLSYNQYRRVIQRLSTLLRPIQISKIKNHIPRESLEEQLKRPLSDYILKPRPEPFDISPPEMLEPLFNYLQSTDNVHQENVFVKGTVCIDGRLDLCKQVIGPSGVMGLINSLKFDSSLENPRVKHLLLGNNFCGNELGRAIGKFIKSGKSALTTWYIAGNNLDADGIKPVCEALHGDTQVKQLWLKRNPIHENGIIHICNMLNNNNYLQVLDLTNTGLFDTGATLLLNNIPQTLQYLYLSCNGLTEKTCIVASNKIPKSKLKHIGLGCNRLKDDGVKYIAEILENPDCKIQRLEIASCGIGELGAKYISNALKINKSLVLLNFGFLKSTNDLGEVPNNIGSVGAEFLADALKVNTTLRSLDIIYTGVMQSGIKALAETMSNNNTSLVHLNIEQFGIPHNELSREVIRKSIQKNRDMVGEENMKEISKLIDPEHLEEIKSVYRIS